MTSVDKIFSIFFLLYSISWINSSLEIVSDYNIKSTLFTLNDVISEVKSDLLSAINAGHEISSHGTSHKRPLTISKAKIIFNLFIMYYDYK